MFRSKNDIYMGRAKAISTEQASRVTAATGALGPVLIKLNDLLQGGKSGNLERWWEDIQFIRSELGSVFSLLQAIWDRDDLGLDVACKNWMADARMLSYSMEEDIDGISRLTHTETDATSPFEGLKNQVQYLADRCSEDWKSLAVATSVELHHQPGPNVDPRSGFLHKHASELLEMDDKKYQLTRLLQEHHTVCIVGFAGIGKTTLADQLYDAIGKKFECQAFVSVSKRPNMTGVLTSLFIQVMASAITNKREVVTYSLGYTEWDRHYSPFVQAIKDILYEDVPRNNIQQKEAGKGFQKIAEEENNLIKKIQDFFGREVSGNKQRQGTGAEEKPDNLIVSITEFLEKKRVGRTVDDFKKYLKEIISKILEDKRYLVIIDDIRDWEDWEFMRKNTLPKINNLGSRIISTTRYKAIAEKYRMDNNSFVYEISGLSPDSATALSERIFEKYDISYIQCDLREPCSSIARMTCGMPLAIIVMSSAVVGQLSVQDRQALDLEQFHVAQSRALEGFLTIPCLDPLVESFRHEYHELPLHLKTCLLHCCIYPPYHNFSRNDLIWIWIAEGFVHKEEEAQSYIDELINKGFIRAYSSATTLEVALKYQMNFLILHFLRCKSQEDYFLLFPDCVSDLCLIPAIPPVRRLCIQSYHYSVDISGLNVSDTRFLYVFDYTWITSLKHFEHLQMLFLHGGHLTNADLDDICGLLGLRWLSLRVKQINVLPKEIRKLQNLKTFDVSNTGLLALPVEIGELKHLETLDVSNTMLTELPMEICRLQQLKALKARNSCIRELPKEIRELQHLETLDISHTMVAKLPEEIGLLHLKTLDAGGTYIREVCKEICNLGKLETLDLRSTMITELPEEIRKLVCLKTLIVRDTIITELPKEIGELHRLEMLDVSDTKLAKLPDEFVKLKILKTLNISNTMVRELPWEGGLISNSVSVVVDDNDPPTVVRVLRNDSTFSLAENRTMKLSITLFDHFGSSMELLQFARFRIGQRDLGVPTMVKDNLNNICSLEISVWKLEEKDFKFLGEMPKLHALTLHLELRPQDPITITPTGFLQLENFCIDCRVPRLTFQKRAMPKLKHLDFKFYACRPTEHPIGIKHLQSLQSIIFRCGSPRYGSDAPGISAVIDHVKKEAQENPNRITFCVNDSSKEVYPEKGIELLEENGTIIDGNSKNIDGAGSSSVSGVVTSLFPNHIDEEGGIIPVRCYYPFGAAE